MRNVVLSGLLVTLMLLPVRALPAGKVVADGVAAQVNSNFITIGDIMIVIQAAQKQLTAKYSGAELAEKMGAAFSNALNSLIERRLILDAYEKQENKFPDQYVDGRVDEITQDMFNGDRADLMAALAKEKLNYEEWRKDMKDHVLVSTMRKMNVEQNVTVSARAVRKAYEDNLDRHRSEVGVKLRMIAINCGSSGEENDKAVKKAAMVWKKLSDGADFAATAKEFSEGSNAAEGGDRGVIQLGKLRSELAKAAASTKSGEISGIVSAGDQLYIIKVEERKDSFADLQPQIERELRKIESDRVYSVWIQRLRKDAYVKVFDTGVF